MSKLRKALLRTSPKAKEEALNVAVARAAVRANSAQRVKLITSLMEERSRTTGREKELVELALAYLGEKPDWLFDPIFKSGIPTSLPFDSTPKKIKKAALDYLLSVAEWHIVHNAQQFDSDALWLLAKHSITLVRELNIIARNRSGRDALRHFAEQTEVWPVLKSEHLHYNQDENDFFGSLKVAKALGRKIANARWKPGTLADRLWCEIDNARRKPVWPGFRHGELKWLTEEAQRLPAFDADGAPDDWSTLALRLCITRMSVNGDFCREVRELIPRSKRKRGEKSWLKRFFQEKFRNMQSQGLTRV